MHRIAKANIDRFKELLKDETDPAKRAMEMRLLAEEEQKLAYMPKPEKRSLEAFLEARQVAIPPRLRSVRNETGETKQGS